MQHDYQGKTPTEKKKFWEEQIRTRQGSSLSQREYCKRNGIGQSQWFYWRRRWRDAEAGLTLVPLKLPSVSGYAHRLPVVRVITPNGFTIELDADAPITSLPNLIREVAAI